MPGNGQDRHLDVITPELLVQHVRGFAADAPHQRVIIGEQLRDVALEPAERVYQLQRRSDRRHLGNLDQALRSEEHTSELQSLMRISYAVFCLKKKNKN